MFQISLINRSFDFSSSVLFAVLGPQKLHPDIKQTSIPTITANSPSLSSSLSAQCSAISHHPTRICILLSHIYCIELLILLVDWFAVIVPRDTLFISFHCIIIIRSIQVGRILILFLSSYIIFCLCYIAVGLLWTLQR